MEEALYGIFDKFRVSDDELRDRHERLRQAWLKDGDERKRYKMDVLSHELSKRANKKYKKEHPNAEPRHREHGWYLPNDD